MQNGPPERFLPPVTATPMISEQAVVKSRGIAKPQPAPVLTSHKAPVKRETTLRDLIESQQGVGSVVVPHNTNEPKLKPSSMAAMILRGMNR